MTKFQNKYRIESIRLQNWDYSWDGNYHVTICTKNRKHYFGRIANGNVQLNEWGIIARERWKEIPCHFNNVQLDVFIIMPNHVHGIIIITNQNNKTNNHCTKTNHNHSINVNKHTPFPGKNRFQNQGKKTLSAIVGSYKSACTRTIHQISQGDIPVWQPGFYERIIWDKEEIKHVRKYILKNPVQWEKDVYYGCKQPKIL
jgi:putative transposase